MEKRVVDKISLYYHEKDLAVADQAEKILKEILPIISNLWDLSLSKKCRLYIMRSWQGFIFRAAPIHFWLSFILFSPLIYLRFNKIWKFAGGWAQWFGSRVTVGIKPPDLLELADKTIGEKIFIKSADMEEKLRSLICHEMTHAFAGPYKYPLWLNEGIAMLSVDEYLKKQTVREDTLEHLKTSGGKRPLGYRQVQRAGVDGMVLAYSQGYWVTKYLKEKKPEILKKLLQKKRSVSEIDRILQEGLGIGENLWEILYEQVAASAP